MIGAWIFDPAEATLAGAQGVFQLEDRAARTLELLCNQRGQIVSQAEILRAVWQGRAVSSNSVAVVISELRRRLGDDSKAQEHIATISKRGYRLNVELVSDAKPRKAPLTDAIEPAQKQAWRARLAFAAAAGAAASLIAILLLMTPPPSRAIALLIEPVRNQTGSAAFQPTTQALSELLIKRLSQERGFVVFTTDQARPAAAPRDAITLRSNLILWNGQPTLSIRALTGGGGRVVWSSMPSGVGDDLTTDTLSALKTLTSANLVRSGKL